MSQVSQPESMPTQPAGSLDKPSTPPPIVGIGGSAGALQALMTLLEAVDSNLPAAIVVVLHLSPDHQSHAAEVLQRSTALQVHQVTQRTRLEAGHVYVIAPGTNLITDDGHVQPSAIPTKRPSTVIDLFFRTLGEVHGERAVGIVLSGTGRDGALGITHVKEFGGFAVAQDPESCEHDDMPKAAMATNTIDLVLSPGEIGKRLAELVNAPRQNVAGTASSSDPVVGTQSRDESIDSEERAYHDVLNALRHRTRHDFRNYKRATIRRRLERRTQVHQLANLQNYRDFVQRNPEELTPLLADLLISVTNFFRDPAAFETLQKEVIPALMASVAPDHELRVWVTACASGEESYSLAILLQEQADRMTQAPQVQIFASDISTKALAAARAGLYPANIAADVSDSRLMSYFEKEKSGDLRVRSALREMIVFAQHNVLNDPPFSRVDLICCRNLLIYLDRTAQATTLEMFAYALKPGGYLFLGNAESVDSLSTSFEIVSKEHRIYRLKPEAGKTMRPRLPSQMTEGTTSLDVPMTVPGPQDGHATEEQALAMVQERAVVDAAPPNVLIDASYRIERTSQGAERFLVFRAGVPTRDLLDNVAPDVRVELRTALLRATESRRSVQTIFLRSDEHGSQAGMLLALSVHPIKDSSGEPVRWLVVFDEPAKGAFDVPVADEHQGTPYVSAIERLEAENKSLKSLLQETLDRSAVSNEELKASNEELQAINEELRSAKEELETSKEELQSVNEELTTVNFELRLKVDEAGRNNDDLRNLIDASDIATVFLDPGMNVKRFTPEASKLFALIPTDVGRPLMDVKSRLLYDHIVQDASAVFKHLRPVERSVSSLDGQHFLARILPYRTSSDRIGGAVLTFIDVTAVHEAERRVQLSEERLRDAIAASKDFAVISTDMEGLITTWNEGAERIFGHPPQNVLGTSMDVIFTASDCASGVPAQERAEAVRTGRAADERWHVRRDGTTFFCSGVTTPLHNGVSTGFLKIARDVSESKNLEESQRSELHHERQANASVKHALDLKDRFLAVMSHELKQPLNLIRLSAELMVRLPESKILSSVQRIGTTIERAVATQETIVNDLLDLSRVQTGKLQLHREPTDLVEMVQRLTQALAQDAAVKNLTLNVHLPDQVVCNCDAVRVEQIIWNLLGNALKFTPAGGDVRVVVVTTETQAVLAISDTGMGIAAESIDTVFDLFQQAVAADSTGPQRAGLGIGLALVRELALAHGGRVEASSAGLGKGSTFTVWLPLCQQTLNNGRQKPSEGLAGRRVLLVDDEIDSLTIFAELLEIEGMVVEKTTSASAALAMLKGGNFDLLFSDIGMPEMSGLDLIQQAHRIFLKKSFQSIAITGFGREADVHAALKAGFDYHLSKPISLERLSAALKVLEEKSSKSN